MNKEEAIKKLANIIFDTSEFGDIPYDTEDEYCAMNIARRRIDELFQPLPDNLDEAEFEYAQSLDENPANQEEDKMIYDAFKAGAKWMAGQMKQKQPEVDLEKEYKEYVEDDPVFSKLTNRIVGLAIARHFLNIGLNARTEENK